jgi:MaoC like domain
MALALAWAAVFGTAGVAGAVGKAEDAEIHRYAAASGDRNPIHMSSLGAKAFGFPRRTFIPRALIGSHGGFDDHRKDVRLLPFRGDNRRGIGRFQPVNAGSASAAPMYFLAGRLRMDDLEDRGAVQVQDYFGPRVQFVAFRAPDALAELCVEAGLLELLDRCSPPGAVGADEQDVGILRVGGQLGYQLANGRDGSKVTGRVASARWKGPGRQINSSGSTASSISGRASSNWSTPSWAIR